jgi:ion channel
MLPDDRVSSRPPQRLPIVRSLTRFWSDDKGLSIFSAMLLVVIFVMPPLLADSAGRRLPGDVAFAVLLVSGVLALSDRGLARTLMLPFALLTVAVDLGSWLVPVPPPLVQGTGLLALLLLLAVVLFQTLRGGPITFHRIQGGVGAYLLLGIVWAHAYSMLALARPGAFSGAARAADGPRAFLYYSFVTLTTVGYGDVLPVHPAARSLAMLEAVTGPLYLAILLARLVSLAVAPGAPTARKGVQ